MRRLTRLAQGRARHKTGCRMGFLDRILSPTEAYGRHRMPSRTAQDDPVSDDVYARRPIPIEPPAPGRISLGRAYDGARNGHARDQAVWCLW